jgi:hypothetical protein
MAIVTVSFYDRLPVDANGHTLSIFSAPLASAAYTPGATQLTAAAPTGARFARVATDTAIHVGYGATATNNDPYVPASSVELFGVSAGLQLSLVAAA